MWWFRRRRLEREEEKMRLQKRVTELEAQVRVLETTVEKNYDYIHHIDTVVIGLRYRLEEIANGLQENE